jgi:hypothetical protein
LDGVATCEAGAYGQLAELVGNSQLCLGVFGTTTKAQGSSRNKVFDALAIAKAFITPILPVLQRSLASEGHRLERFSTAGDSTRQWH